MNRNGESTMNAQSHMEKVLRDMHIMLSQAKGCNGEKNLVIINKNKFADSLREMSECMNEMLEEYGMTQQGRDAAERDVKKRGEEIITDAKGKAEDVYAASVLYTDEALKRVRMIMKDSMESVHKIYDKMNEDMEKEIMRVRTNQTDLTGYLQDLADSDKYMKILEEQNKKIAKEKADENSEVAEPVLAAPKPQIRINETYFREHGLSLEEEEIPEEKMEKVTPEINVNLDAEYFKWKEQEANGGEIKDAEKTGKKSLFGKFGK